MAGDRLRELHDEYMEILLDNIRQSEYPSRELMNRVEVALRDEERAAEYVEVLLTKIQGLAPSLQLLDRIQRMINRLELHRELTS